MNVIRQIYSNRSTDYLLYFVVGHSKFAKQLHDIRHSCPYEVAAQAITNPLQFRDFSFCTFVTQCRNIQTATQTNSFRVRDQLLNLMYAFHGSKYPT